MLVLSFSSLIYNIGTKTRNSKPELEIQKLYLHFLTLINQDTMQRDLVVKHLKLLYGFITVLGIVFVTTFTALLYCNYYLNRDIWLELFPSSYLRSVFGYFLLFGGTIFLTVGLLGIGRQYVKNRRNLLTILAVVLVPSFMFVLYLVWLGMPTVAF